MSVTAEELSEYVNKRVILHVIQNDGSTQEIEGKVEAASEAGMAFKEKGKSSLELYMPGQIAEIQRAPEKPKQVIRKRVNPVQLGQARQHLVDRHGVPISWAKDNTEEAAFEYHEQLDHSDLGHKHEVAKSKENAEREQALSDAEDNDSDEE